MQTAAKVVHLLSLGLWAGGVTFFSFFTALPIINRMKQLAGEKPQWLPGLADERTGNRVAGVALSAVFDRYFYYQLVCGVLALITAFFFVQAQGALHKVRVGLIVLALALVAVNTFVFHPRISQLRVERYAADVSVSEPAEKQFGTWHNYSLLTDMAGLVLVLIVLALAVALPRTVQT